MAESWKATLRHIVAFAKTGVGTRPVTMACDAGHPTARKMPVPSRNRYVEDDGPPRERDPREAEARDREPDLGDLDQPLARVPVGRGARGERQKQHRQRQRQPDQAEAERRLRPLVHLPPDRHVRIWLPAFETRLPAR